jgi:hypothetical protein
MEQIATGCGLRQHAVLQSDTLILIRIQLAVQHAEVMEHRRIIHLVAREVGIVQAVDEAMAAFKICKHWSR